MKTSSHTLRENLILFNLETNSESKVLASNSYWIREFAKYFKEIMVVSTHLGVIENYNNVKYLESGGGSLLRKIKAIYIHLSMLPYIIKQRDNLVIHYHMSTKSLSIIGIFAKIFRVKQSLWYSHSKADIFLKVFRFVPDYFFSPTNTSFPLFKSNKLVSTNHAVPIDLIGIPKTKNLDRFGLVSVGRFVKIKHLEKIISAVGSAKILDRNVTLIGPIGVDPDYEKRIGSLSILNKVNLNVLGPMNYLELLNIYSKFDLYFSGTPMSVDKATIEAAMSGCFVITENLEAQKLTGMEIVWDELNLLDRSSIVKQLETIGAIDSRLKKYLRLKVSARSIELNSLETTVAKIVGHLRSI